MSEPWAIVRIQVDAARSGRDALAADLDRLDELAGALASAPDVGGVEHDPTARQSPELRVYTTPAALDDVMARARAWAERFELRVVIAGEVRTDDDWRDAWKEFYRPILLGAVDRAAGGESNPRASTTRTESDHGALLLLRPSWIPRNHSDPPLEVVLDPGRAFGTGLHETTRLCLDRLCELATSGWAPARVLDVGCGSGILALCAARLFPRAHVVAIDDDPEATDTTRENAANNGLALEIITGDLPSLPAGPSFDLVLANIRAETLVPRARAIAERTQPGGRVTLSGVLTDERDEVAQAYAAAGFEVLVPARSMDTWCAIDLRRSS
jgi:ribosomal protein L11 methyltransferase